MNRECSNGKKIRHELAQLQHVELYYEDAREWGYYQKSSTIQERKSEIEVTVLRVKKNKQTNKQL